MEEKDIIRIVNDAERKSEWKNIVHKEIAINSYNLGLLHGIDKVQKLQELVCECGFNWRSACDCQDKECKHPSFIK